MSSTELLACYDEEGNLSEPKTRGEVHTEPLRYWHATNGIWVVDRDGKLLCSQRAFSCEGNPGKWQTTFGGHVKAGLTWAESAVQELEEEIGLKVRVQDLYLIEKSKLFEVRHLAERYLYLYSYDQPLQFNDGEVIAIQWMTIDQYQFEKATHPDQWCNGLSPESALLIQQYLKQLS